MSTTVLQERCNIVAREWLPLLANKRQTSRACGEAAGDIEHGGAGEDVAFKISGNDTADVVWQAWVECIVENGNGKTHR